MSRTAVLGYTSGALRRSLPRLVSASHDRPFQNGWGTDIATAFCIEEHWLHDARGGHGSVGRTPVDKARQVPTRRPLRVANGETVAFAGGAC